MASDTRERLTKTAHDLFYAEGFHAVGLDRIFREVGVTKTTFYNHFASKDELVLAALEWHDRWWQNEFRQMLRRHGGDAPIDQLRALPAVLEEAITSQEFNGCIFVNVAVEFPNPGDPAHRLAAQHKCAMVDILREIAGYAGASDPPALAEELSMILEGAYVTRQVGGIEHADRVAARLVSASLDGAFSPVHE